MKNLLLLFCLLFIQKAYLQDIPFKIIKSEVFKDKYGNTDISDILEDGNGGFVLIRPYAGSIFSGKAGYYFEHYDNNLTLVNNYDYQFDYSETHGSTVIGILANEEEIHVVDFVYNREEKAFICSAKTAKFTDFNFISKELFRMGSDEIKGFKYFSHFDTGFRNGSGTNFIANEDGTAFAITVLLKDKSQETQKLYLFDNYLNKNIEHTFKRDVRDKDFRQESVEVSKDGQSLYLLGKIWTDETVKKRKGGRYQYELTRITANGSHTRAFDSNENFVASLKTLLIGNKLVCMGFYSEERDSRYKGVSYFELDPLTLDIVKTKYNPFTEQFMIDKYGKSRDKELRNISFRNIFVTASGDLVFNGEEYYYTIKSSGSMDGIPDTKIYYHNDIVSVKLDSNGDMQWARNIKKQQRSDVYRNPLHSYAATVKGDDTFFFINTRDKVKKLRNDRIQFRQASARNSDLNVIRINSNGDFDHQEILNSKDSKMAFFVAQGKIILKNNEIIFFGRRGKNKQLIKISL